MCKNKHKGFTLVEIAIVLVVVGLLIGGLLKGREMITNSKIKRVERDRSGIITAVQAYQDRYRILPGDDDRASLRFALYSDGVNDPLAIDGDSSGSLDGNWMALADTETANVWKHLRAAGLIPGSGDDDTQPSNAYGGVIGLRYGSLNLSGHVIIFGEIGGPVARILEEKIDDVSPSTGTIQSDIDPALMDGFAASTAGNTYNDAIRYHMAFDI